MSRSSPCQGYVLEAVIPLKELGVAEWPGLWPGRQMRGDLGIIASDSTGRRIARLYRYNQDTQVINDVPTEAVLVPKNWGLLEVDKTDAQTRKK